MMMTTNMTIMTKRKVKQREGGKEEGRIEEEEGGHIERRRLLDG